MSDQPFAGRVRVRVNGLLVKDRSLLLVKLNSKTRTEPFWIPPGGGVEFGELLEETLIREMKEETGLDINVGGLRYTSQYINPPWHAVEFYFDVEAENHDIKLGSDPELDDGDQMLQDIRYIPFSELPKLNIVPEYLKDRYVQDYLRGIEKPMYIKTDQKYR